MGPIVAQGADDPDEGHGSCVKKNEIASGHKVVKFLDRCLCGQRR